MKNKVIMVLIIILMMGITNAQEINLSEMTTEEKVAQMFILRVDIFQKEYLELGIGGYFLDNQKTKENYTNLIKQYNDSKISPFFSTDLEGYWNPFVNFFESKNFGEIKNYTESYELGISHAKILQEMGFNLDFSPIVETKNNVWEGRSFTGNELEIKEKIRYYIKGLEENGILSTAKHYPGGNLLKNPHLFKVYVTEENLEYKNFKEAIKSNVSAIMVGHTIINKKQATVSKEIIYELKKNFNGLVITDDITMMGLRWSYLFNHKKMIKDLFLAGNDIVLHTGMNKFSKLTPKKLEKDIKYITKLIEQEIINESEIDKSVTKILTKKGYEVIY